MTNDKDSEDALTIAYLLGVKHGRAEQNTQTDALKIAREAAIEECALLVEGMGTSHDSHAGERFAKAIRALKESK
jgi:hypothetical protein